MRVETAGVLGILGTRLSVKPLLNALSDESELVRSNAVYSLGTLGTSKNIATIEKYLALEDSDMAKVDF